MLSTGYTLAAQTNLTTAFFRPMVHFMPYRSWRKMPIWVEEQVRAGETTCDNYCGPSPGFDPYEISVEERCSRNLESSIARRWKALKGWARLSGKKDKRKSLNKESIVFSLQSARILFFQISRRNLVRLKLSRTIFAFSFPFFCFRANWKNVPVLSVVAQVEQETDRTETRAKVDKA